MNQSTLRRKPKRFVKKSTPRFPSRGLLLYFLPLAAVPATIIAFSKANPVGIGVNMGCYALFVLGAWLLREGLGAEVRYHEKRITRPPKWPLKTWSAVIISSATGLIAWLGAGHSFLVAMAFGCGAFMGMYLTYGFDPRSEKMVTGSHGYTAAEIAQTIEEAEETISGIEQANDEIVNGEFNDRIDRICEVARDILVFMEKDPGDIRRARKFLNVYLEGARKVADGYAGTHRNAPSDELEENFRNVLDTIEAVFNEQKEKLLENDYFDLDVQMEVLTTQLKREGII